MHLNPGHLLLSPAMMHLASSFGTSQHASCVTGVLVVAAGMNSLSSRMLTRWTAFSLFWTIFLVIFTVGASYRLGQAQKSIAQVPSGSAIPKRIAAWSSSIDKVLAQPHLAGSLFF